jgi:hypothetical protein
LALNSDETLPLPFWQGVFAGEVYLRRQTLSGSAPLIATFCWFATLVLFAQISFLIYQSSHNAPEALGAFALMASLHIAGLMTLYLSTLAEKDNIELRRNVRFPFSLSLLASVIETLSAVGVLIYLIIKSVVDMHLHLGASLNTPSGLVAEAQRLVPLIAERHGIFLGSVVGLLILSLVLAHYAFGLMRRRSGLDLDGVNTFSGTQIRTSEPPVTSADLKTQITRLAELKVRLLTQAEKTGNAGTLSARINEVDARLKAIMTDIEARRLASDHLPAPEGRLRALNETMTIERAAFDTELAGLPAGAMQRHLKRILSLLMGAMTLISHIFALLEDSRRDIDAEITGLETTLTQARRERGSLEDSLKERREESERLRAEAQEVEARLERLYALAERIDEINADWTRPQTWRFSLTPDAVVIDNAPLRPQTYRRPTLINYKPGIFLLLLLTSALAVTRDFLIQLQPLTGGKVEFGGNLLLTGLLLLACMAMKLIYTVGLVGAWKTIASSAEPPAAHRRTPRTIPSNLKLPAPMAEGKPSRPSLDDAVRVGISSLIGFLIFAIICGEIYFQKAGTPDTLWAEVRIAMQDYYLIPFLFGAGVFICALAPFWVYVWEDFSRQTTVKAGARKEKDPMETGRPVTWLLLVLGFIGSLFAAFVFAGMLGVALQDMWIGDSVPAAPCPKEICAAVLEAPMSPSAPDAARSHG